MSTVIVYDGVNYTIPSTDDVDWGDEVTKFLVAIPNGMLTKSGGAWHLTDADLDLGGAYGLASLYYKTKTATPALSGVLRLASGDFISWRNTANSGDVKLAKSAGNFLTWNDIDLVDLSTGQTLTNKIIDAVDNSITRIKNINIAPDAAIEWSKIAFSGDFGSTSVITTGGVKLGSSFHVTLQADPSEDYDFIFPDTDGTTGQALVKSLTGKLEWATVPGLALNHNAIIVGDPSNLPSNPDTSAVGDILADDINGLTIKNDVITDAMVKSDAAIALSKIAALTASRAVVTDASGFLAAATVTAAELGWVSGVTSGIQAQINAVVNSVTPLQTIISDTKEPMGLVTLPTPPTVTYEGSRQIKIAHPFFYYYKGTRVSSVADVTVTVPNTTGAYYLVFTDSSLTAQAVTSVEILNQVIWAGFYWNATTGDYIFLEERHGIEWSANEHKQAHLTRGAAYESGGAASGYLIGGDALTSVQIALDATNFWDEDIRNALVAKLEGDNWDKWYRTGVNGDWRKDTSDTIPAFWAGTPPNGVAQINTVSGSWGLTPVTNNNYFNTYIFATNSAQSANRFIIIPGQNQASTLSGAQAFSVANLSLGSLPVQEILPLYKVTLRYRTGNTGNNARVTIEAIEDIRRTTSPGVSAGVSGTHNSLSGRSDADSHPVSAITGLNGETASSTVRVTMPQDTLANLTALPRKQGTTYYATDTKKFYLDDGAALKIVGGGLVPTPIDKDYASTLESGKHYVYNGAGMTGNKTLNVQAVASESNFKVTVYNIPSGYKLILDANSSETFRKDDTDYTTVEFVATEVEQSAEFVSNNTQWIVDDGSNALGTVWGGAFTVTGPFTPQGGIVGKTDGVAVAAGYIGELKVAQISRSSGTSLTTGTPASITSISNVGKGEWLVSGFIGFTGTATSFTAGQGLINKAGDTSTDIDNGRMQTNGGTLGLNTVDYTAAISPFLMRITNDTDDVYLTVLATFSGGTCNGYGRILMQRIA